MGTGSEAVARLEDGKTVFVEGGAPGDVAVIEIDEEKPSFARAHVISLEEESPIRVAAACGHAAQCGGCPWQHLAYEAQLAAKRDNVVAALVHTARMDASRAEELVAEPVACKRRWGYRNKLELGCSRDGERFEVGFRREGTHDIATPDRCPVAVSAIERAPRALRGALRFAQGASDLGIYRIGVRASLRTRDVEVALWTPPGPFPRGHVAKTLESALRATSVVRALADPGKARKVKKVEVLSGRGFWRERMAIPGEPGKDEAPAQAQAPKKKGHRGQGARRSPSGAQRRGEIEFATTAPSFFQVNTAQAEKLVACALEGLGDVSGMLVCDLYAGGGTFSIPLAKAGADVIAIEAAGSSVRDLRRNAEANRADIEVIGGDAEHEFAEIGELDALLVDPPRAGLATSVIDDIVDAAPERVAYVSCNPVTWARDVARFEERGWRLGYVRPVDMFPQTPHIEVASCLVRERRSR